MKVTEFDDDVGFSDSDPEDFYPDDYWIDRFDCGCCRCCGCDCPKEYEESTE